MPNVNELTKTIKDTGALLWIGLVLGFGLVLGVRLAHWLLSLI